MKLLTKKTDYAVRALMMLAREEGYASSREISDKLNIPYDYVRKILHGLIRAGYIVSREGGEGGYRIAKDPHRITVADIISTMQGEIQMVDCMFRDAICSNRRDCVIRWNIKKIEKMVVDEFRGITIGGLNDQTGGGLDEKEDNKNR